MGFVVKMMDFVVKMMLLMEMDRGTINLRLGLIDLLGPAW